MRSIVAPLARRRSSSERKCSSARTGFATSRNPSSSRPVSLRPKRPRFADNRRARRKFETADPIDREMSVQKRNATAAVIGAGDYIGAEIAKKFALEGFTVFAGRRNVDK